MRKYVENCLTKLTETYMNKHLISHNTPDRMNDEGTSDMFPLSNKFYDDFKYKFNNIIKTISSNELRIESICKVIDTFLIENKYSENWVAGEDEDFKNELIELLTTENRLINCENCRSLMGKCKIFD